MTPRPLPLAVRARLEELCGRYGLPESALAALAKVLSTIAPDPHAPTTVTAPARTPRSTKGCNAAATAGAQALPS